MDFSDSCITGIGPVYIGTPLSVPFGKNASACVDRAIKMGEDLLYVSSVYLCDIEDALLPVLKKLSGRVLHDVFRGSNSPEKINPVDRKHREHNLKTVTRDLSLPFSARAPNQRNALKLGTMVI